MALGLQYAAIIDEGERRFVEARFASDESENPAEFLLFRLGIEAQKSPRSLEARLEGLQHARDAITHEIQRIEHIRGQDYPDEDWRK